MNKQEIHNKGIAFSIRSAVPEDAQQLSELRLRIDGETEYLDREPGEAFIDVPGFEQLIKTDTEKPRNLFLVAEVGDRIIGFSRCEGNDLKRFSHKVEFGVCVLKDYWGYGIGKNLLQESIGWADSTGIQKMTLNVLETNDKAISLYQKLGFEMEGVLKNDKLLAGGRFYNTVVMGRLKE
ncbi:GNAT family N-acetyltransferase [Paenibacillus enshidis]|uniref:GNAT family N-acetyltransferase n=1 Tax=Paenibacillus enshidis TaxID=1458439 RepID=A0ABV5ATG2_9BACL